MENSPQYQNILVLWPSEKWAKQLKLLLSILPLQTLHGTKIYPLFQCVLCIWGRWVVTFAYHSDMSAVYCDVFLYRVISCGLATNFPELTATFLCSCFVANFSVQWGRLY